MKSSSFRCFLKHKTFFFNPLSDSPPLCNYIFLHVSLYCSLWINKLSLSVSFFHRAVYGIIWYIVELGIRGSDFRSVKSKCFTV